ncbi:MAG: hypothetical protein ACE5LS_01360 [Thermoplasmata archaeon]
MLSVEYLSGFIDGEGSLSLARIPRPRGSKEYCVRISIANTNRQILEEIQDEYGGTLASSGKRPSRWKTVYVLIWTNAAAAYLLVKVAPHLLVKSSHASALLEFLEHLGMCRRDRDRKGRLLPLSREEIRIREAYYRRLKHLNLRGQNPRRQVAVEQGDSDSQDQKADRISPEYLAGFIDAEGCLAISRTHARKYGTIQYRPRVTLSNTHGQTLSQIQRDYGGLVYRYPRAKVGWKDSYTLVWTEGLIPIVLSLVSPHLRIKGRQAAILRDFNRHIRDTPMNRRGSFWIPHPREIIDFRERLYQRMRKLNTRGIQPPST